MAAINYHEEVSRKLGELIDLCESAHIDPEYCPLAYMVAQCGKMRGMYEKPTSEGKAPALLSLSIILRDLKEQLDNSKEGDIYDFKVQIACDRRDPMGVEPFWATANMDKEVMTELMEEDGENYMAGREIQTISLR